jgi:hypothetical protein
MYRHKQLLQRQYMQLKNLPRNYCLYGAYGIEQVSAAFTSANTQPSFMDTHCIGVHMACKAMLCGCVCSM